MDKHYESIYHSAEDTNWWFKSRQDFVYRYLTKHGIPTSAHILDIGCGGGGLLSYLHSRGYTRIAGIDLSPEAVAFCNSRGLTNVRNDDAQYIRTQSPASFDLIIASDVLEHIDKPLDAITRWKELLAPHGKLIIFVPAFQALWSERDVLNHHITRYTQKKLITLVESTGLKTEQATYWNFFMFIPYAAILKIKKRTKNKIVTLRKEETLTNRVLKLILRLENTLILHGIRLPFGVSFLGIFKKETI